MFRSVLLLASFSLATFAAAQSPDRLVGITRNLGDLRHLSQPACNVLANCSPAGFPSAAGMPANAGGTAWDPVRGGAWISNGQFLACVDDACNYLCTPFAVPGMNPVNFIVGLEVVESRNELWLVDNNDTLRMYSRTCPPVPLRSCQIAFIDPTYSTTGLAVDELNGHVFYSRTLLGAADNVIARADLAAPCTVTSAATLLPCAGAPLSTTGLACRSGSNTLFATDGLRTISCLYNVAGGLLTLAAPNCCQAVPAGADPLMGLAVRPGRATPAGATCANGSCFNCAMDHDTNGDSVLGNAQFALHLGGAPAGSLVWCLVGAGPCATPGVTIPALCGPIYATPVLGTLGPALSGGGVGCTGSADFPMALPAAAGLAGVVLSSQCVVLCSNVIGLGTSVSNCLSFELQGV